MQGLDMVAVYLDDIIITGTTKEEHLKTLNLVLERLQSAGLHLNRTKCFFLQPSLDYLGHRLDEHGIHPTQEKVRAIRDAPEPKNITELRSFLGLINYYGKFLSNLSMTLSFSSTRNRSGSGPLHRLKHSSWLRRHFKQTLYLSIMTQRSRSSWPATLPSTALVLFCLMSCQTSKNDQLSIFPEH